MTRLPLALFLAAIFFCFSAFVTMGTVEPIVTICTAIVAGICVLAGLTMMERKLVAIFVAVVRRVWFMAALGLSAVAAVATGVYFVGYADRPLTGLALAAIGCFLVLVYAWRDVRRGTASSHDPSPALVRPIVHQLTSDITPPQPRSRPDVGEGRKRRARRMTDDRRNAQKKGYGK